jgi:hypothetical protein
MYNNASYQPFIVSGTTSFAFTASGLTVRMTPAIYAWTGATVNMIEPEPGIDGRAFVAYKVTGPVDGTWHYEYAISNQNLDRAIQSFSVPLGCGITVNNLGFHAPLNEPGSAHDGTTGDAGFSNAPWASTQTSSALTWSSETFAQNPNANAIRWGTLYNFRFDSNRPPVTTNATVGFFKTGTPVTVAIQGPAPCGPLTVVSAVSRKTHGSAGDFNVVLPLTGTPGIECRSGGATNDYSLAVTLGSPVSVDGSPQAEVVSGTGTIGNGGLGNGGVVMVSGNVVTIPLTNVTNAQTIYVRLNSVNDGSAIGNITIPMSRLLGDVNANGLVNSTDTSLVQAQSGKPVTLSNFRMDVNANGLINSTDTSIVQSKSGTGLP